MRTIRGRLAIFTVGLMVAAFAVASAPGVAATVAAHRAQAPTLSAHLRAVLARDVRLHAHPATGRRAAGTTKSGIKVFDTNNWSGYVALPKSTGVSQFDMVNAEIEQPSVNCSATSGQTFAYQWVGLDGWGSPTVEQAGVATQCINGQPKYFTWYETYPGPVQIRFSASPGDSLFVEVSHLVGTTTYAMDITDRTTGQSFSVNAPCEAGSTCKNASVEVITEGYTSTPWEGTSDFGVEPYASIHVYGIKGTTDGIGPTLKNTNYTTVESRAIGAVSNELTTGVSSLDNSNTESAFAVYWEREN